VVDWGSLPMQSEWNSESLRLSHFFTTVLAFGHDDDCTNEQEREDRSRLKLKRHFLLTDFVYRFKRRKFPQKTS
jgi:hypothetical protein